MHPDQTLGFRFFDESQAFFFDCFLVVMEGRPRGLPLICLYGLRGCDRLFAGHLKETMADGYAGGLAIWWTFGRA